jgi:hypothetical protein
MELEKRKPGERLGDAGDAEPSLIRYRDPMLEIRVTEILGENRFAVEHYQGAQPDITLPLLDIGESVPEHLAPIATCRQWRRALRSHCLRRSADTQHHQKREVR